MTFYRFRLQPSALLSALSVSAFLLVAGCGGSDDPVQGSGSVPAASVTNDGGNSINPAGLDNALTDIPASALSTAEAQSLVFMREEEQLAYYVYAASSSLWAEPIFANIAASETTHAAAVKTLLDRYQIADPLAGKPAGVFSNPDLQAIYDRLVAASRTGVIQALQVGAEIEELDIRDIAQQMRSVDNADILFVYANLLLGSRNHLRSFWKVLQQRGETYVPKYITQAEFDAIVNSPAEIGR